MKEYLVQWVAVNECMHAIYVANNLIEAAQQCVENTKIKYEQIYLIIKL